MIGCGYLTPIFYRNIPAFHISWEDLTFRQRSWNRFIISTMSCRNVILVSLLTITVLQYSTFCGQIEKTYFSLFWKISTNVTVVFGSRRFIKDMNFYRNEFFRTISSSCFRVSFISGSKNHKSHDNFSFIFTFSIKLFLWLWGVAFLKFSENYKKETAWWRLYFATPQVTEAETFFWGFLKFPEQLRTIASELLNVFFSKLFNRHFSSLKHVPLTFPLWIFFFYF